MNETEFILTPPAPPQVRVFIVRGRTIRGILRPESPCDDRCVYAKGNLCECSCGGKNHGKHYDASIFQRPAAPTQSQDKLF
jgi:hypothetical protein